MPQTSRIATKSGVYKFSKKQKSRSHLRIVDAWTVICSKFCAKDPQRVGATAQNLLARNLCAPALNTAETMK